MSYFGIGIYRPKFKQNIGTLWRSAYLLGASFIFTIEGEFKEYPTDTQKTWKQIPCYQYNYLSEVIFPVDCKIIGVETRQVFPSAIDLPDFKHPKSCIYLLGNESNGLPLHLLDSFDDCVSIPAIKKQSYNVAMAGTIIMYDRMKK